MAQSIPLSNFANVNYETLNAILDSSYIPWPSGLIERLLGGLLSSAPLRLKDPLIKAHQKLSDYYTKLTSLHTMSGPPVSKFHGIHSYNSVPESDITFFSGIGYAGLLADCETDVSLREHVDISREQLHEYFITNYATMPTSSSAAAAAAPTAGTALGSPQKVNFLARYKIRSPASKDELEEFYR